MHHGLEVGWRLAGGSDRPSVVGAHMRRAIDRPLAIVRRRPSVRLLPLPSMSLKKTSADRVAGTEDVRACSSITYPSSHLGHCRLLMSGHVAPCRAFSCESCRLCVPRRSTDDSRKGARKASGDHWKTYKLLPLSSLVPPRLLPVTSRYQISAAHPNRHCNVALSITSPIRRAAV